jgi:hypothetical protein
MRPERRRTVRPGARLDRSLRSRPPTSSKFLISPAAIKEINILHSFVLPNNCLVHCLQPRALRWLREIVCPYFEKVEDILVHVVSTIATSRPEDTPKENCFAPIARLLRNDSSFSIGQPPRNVDLQDAVPRRHGPRITNVLRDATNAGPAEPCQHGVTRPRSACSRCAPSPTRHPAVLDNGDWKYPIATPWRWGVKQSIPSSEFKSQSIAT